ncbi:MAG: CHASE2 domain-containing protein [Candidatus Electrothrix sp. AR3]|nr:CHASE2 domain-containing protein [Candidatus Electrothrix sp. AR3]
MNLKLTIPTSASPPNRTLHPGVKRCCKQLLFFWAGLLPTLLITVLCGVDLPILSSVSLKIYDYYLCSSPKNPTSNIPLIVDIDEKSLKQYGQWPWPRYRVADLLERINHDDPLAVGLDIIFSEADRTSLKNIYKEISEQFDVPIIDSGVPKYLQDNDIVMADTLAKGPFVPALYFTFDGKKPDTTCTLHPLNIITQFTKEASGKNIQLVQANGVLCNLPIFSTAVKTSGFLNVSPDADGTLRRTPLVIKYQDRIYPNLSLAALITAFPPKRLVLKISQFGIEGIFLDSLFIPLEKNGLFPVNFRGPAHTFEYISAKDILSGHIPKGTFNGKIIFVGTSAAGLNDKHPTPFDPIFPGVEFHANIIDNILTKSFLKQPHWIKGLEMSTVFFSGLLCAFLFAWFGPAIGIIVFFLGGAVLFFGAKSIFTINEIFISPLYPTLSLAIIFPLIYLLKFYLSERSKLLRKQELIQMREAMLETIIMSTETRDNETGNHIKRTQGYMRIMAEALQQSKKYKELITADVIEAICKVAPLHDVGKIGIQDSVLLKPGRLTVEEFEEIKKHTVYGKQIIDTALEQVNKNYFLETALDIAYTHHEKWNGTGYPQGFSGEDIPFFGRMMAIADVYDALTSKRPYKKPLSHEQAIAIMRAERGKHFDPDLIDIFLKIHERFRVASLQYAEEIDRG